jgi:hypothetical protein
MPDRVIRPKQILTQRIPDPERGSRNDDETIFCWPLPAPGAGHTSVIRPVPESYCND